MYVKGVTCSDESTLIYHQIIIKFADTNPNLPVCINGTLFANTFAISALQGDDLSMFCQQLVALPPSSQNRIN